jgi:hypothetical protein
MNEIDEFSNLNYEILANIYELNEIQEVLKSFIFENELSPENQVYLSEISERHIKLCDKIKTLLECYFAEESAAGAPKMLSYHRIYKQLIRV